MICFYVLKVLKLLPTLLPGLVERGILLGSKLKECEDCSSGLFVAQGHGLMWGGALVKEHPLVVKHSVSGVMNTLKDVCEKERILPYFVPVGGFMVTPHFDVDVEELEEIGNRLVSAIKAAMAELNK